MECTEKLRNHILALRAALQSCVNSMENETRGGARQLLTIRNANRVLAELEESELLNEH